MFGIHPLQVQIRKKGMEKYDGYQVFVTTEFDLNEKEVLESYRTRDQIEKAIRTLKSMCLVIFLFVLQLSSCVPF